MGLLKIRARLGQRRKLRAKLLLHPMFTVSYNSPACPFYPCEGISEAADGIYVGVLIFQSIHAMEFRTQQQAQGFPQVTAQALQGQLACATTASTASTPLPPPALTEGPEESPQNFIRTQPAQCGAAFLNPIWVF